MSKEEVLYIFVVGFHHKKGTQIEFSYPPLESLPQEWKNLPSLAMPDGAHNFDKDTVYFHLPYDSSPAATLFGVSCFQQVPLEKVKNKTEDMTRGTVQKAVCVLSTVPLYGYIKVKMELITATFFDGGDFSQTGLLVDAFHHLNDCLPGSIEQHLYEGMSAKDLLLRFRHRTLLLFKLVLLERKVVLFHSPVEVLCNTLLSLLSIHPGVLEKGLYQAAVSSAQGSPCSPLPESQTIIYKSADNNDTHFKVSSNDGLSLTNSETTSNVEVNVNSAGKADEQATAVGIENLSKDTVVAEDALLMDESYYEESVPNSKSQIFRHGESNDIVKDDNINVGCDITVLATLDLSACGLPLSLFGKGNLCFPYLSISYLDFLSSAGVRGFIAGATNVLFKQKRQLTDVLIDVESARIETTCADLRKQLALTTEDLRFMEQLLRGVFEPRDIYIPGVGKEGGEEWIRVHFRLYITALLRTSLLQDGSREMDHFNSQFIAAWRNTHNYRMWLALDHDGILELNPGHPSAGSLSVQDVKLKISQAMQSSESGRKINQAVLTTGRAVGGAITQAKGVLSGLWNHFSAPQEGKPVKPM